MDVQGVNANSVNTRSHGFGNKRTWARWAIKDSLPGKSKPRVTESCRSGFIFSRGEGHEIILRKVEVRTSSQ